MRFFPHNSLIELVDYDYNILPLMSRFSIPLGFDNITIRDACLRSGIDVNMFLLIVNYQISGVIEHELMEQTTPAGVVDFLARSHTYFLDYKFNHIRANLLGALDPDNGEINPSIVTFFDDYVNQVRKHFSYEEQTVFPHIRALLAGEKSSYSIDTFSRQHDEIADVLAELKNIILRYYHTSLPDRMYDVLVDLYNCQEDLDKHADIENNILIPLVRRLEITVGTRQ